MSVAERLFGLETEYAFTVLDNGGGGLNRSRALRRFMDLARKRLPHLPGARSTGLFLQNGSRFYVDCGLHPEMSTPECANPWDAVRYVLAGERILADLAGEFEDQDDAVSQAMVFKCNVDYSGTQSTWGCHESYLHRADPDRLPQQIIPHLVSRVIYTGAGGFGPPSSGLEFTLSPRAFHLAREVSDESMHDRGIFHVKDEPLSRKGYHRLHVLCGESLCSETASWLKVATTALVVALVEAGLRPGQAVTLSSPVGALRTFADDPKCDTTVTSASGRRLTAVDIQRHYLAQVELHVDAGFMPVWAEEACRRWRSVLDGLQTDPSGAATSLDWAIKYRLYRDRVGRSGVAWESLSHWSRVVDRLRTALEQAEYQGKRVSVEFVLSQQSPVADEVKRLTPFLQERGLDWDGLRSFVSLRREMCEIDTRFGQVGEKGIFAALDRAGVLTHHVPGVDSIEHAMAHPPAVGRARLRGECVSRFAGSNGRYSCDWEGVWDHEARRLLDLSEPFATEEHWRELPEDYEERPDGLARFRERLRGIRDR